MFACVSILVKGGWKETWAVQRPILAETPASESRMVSLNPFETNRKKAPLGTCFWVSFVIRTAGGHLKSDI